MKKIILIGNIPASLITFRKEIILDLVSKKYDVYCLVNGYTEVEKALVTDWGAIPISHQLNGKGLNPVGDIKATIHLYNLIKQINPDIVFPFFVKPVIFGSIAAKLAKVPKVIGMIEGLGNAFTITPGKVSAKVKIIKSLQILLYKISLPLLDKLILLNNDDKKDLLDDYHIKVKKLDILGGIGVDLNKFSYSLPIQKAQTTFIFIGRLLREKGIFEYIEAAQIVKQKHPNTIFQIIGGLDENNPFALDKGILDNYIKQNIIEYAGHVDNVPEWIRNSDVFVLPSYREGVPRSTQEAMAIGRPVITTDVPGCRDTVIDEYNGFIVKPWDGKDLAQKMMLFIEHPEKIISMGQNGRQMAEDKFDINKINQKLLAILES